MATSTYARICGIAIGGHVKTICMVKDSKNRITSMSKCEINLARG